MKPRAFYELFTYAYEVWAAALHEYGKYTYEMNLPEYLDGDDCDEYEALTHPEDQQWHMIINILDNVDWVDDILDAED